MQWFGEGGVFWGGFVVVVDLFCFVWISFEYFLTTDVTPLKCKEDACFLKGP